MDAKHNLSIVVEPDMIAEHIALLIADELTREGLDAERRRTTLIQAGLLIEIEMKGGNLSNKLLKFRDFDLIVYVQK